MEDIVELYRYYWAAVGILHVHVLRAPLVMRRYMSIRSDEGHTIVVRHHSCDLIFIGNLNYIPSIFACVHITFRLDVSGG